eukprot:Rmarinus@m.20228
MVHKTDVPVFDLAPFLAAKDKENLSEELKNVCKEISDNFRRTGVIIVRDPRVSEDDNNRFLDLLERYWDQPDEEKLKDERPQWGYQVGATPEGREKCRCFQEEACLNAVKEMTEENRPVIDKNMDCKWRFFWRMGERPKETKFPELNAEPVVPAAFPEWSEVMNMWGEKMLGAVTLAAQMAAVGFDMPYDAFSSRMKSAPHLLAPTGSNLNKFHERNTVFAAYHTDLNFMTIHGKSRFPGLFIWLRDGTKTTISIPDGCLLIQAGKQLEYLTGGHVVAGYHEVLFTEGTDAAYQKAKQEGRCCWRSSSTLFSHIASDQILQPLAPFPENPKYPPIHAGEQVAKELDFIKLMPADGGAAK